MFDRFRDSLVYPRRILQYRKDRFIRVFSYMMLFALLMLSSTLIALLRIDTIALSYSDFYQDNLTDQGVDCVIDNGDVTCTDDGGYFYNSTLGLVEVDMGVFEQDPEDTIDPLNMNILFTDDNLVLYYGGMKFITPYEELPEEFHTMDFNDISENPMEFSDQMMAGMGSYLNSKLGIIAPVVLGFGLIGNLFMIVFVVLMNATILKMRFKIIPFRETFNMGVYLGTTLFILLILNGFFGLGYLTIILFLIITFRQTNAISYEIMSRLKK